MIKNLHLERLLDLISSEEVILFAGAGLSKYAGFPMGGELKNLLIDSLSNSEKAEIDMSKNLTDLAEEIFDLKQSNNHILRILKEKYQITPPATEVHDIIAKIPHFKTIITTNYDRLFEVSYGDKAELIYSSNQLSIANPRKTHIFKIHGDLQDVESIILKRSDYNNFFNYNNQNSIFWNSIKDKMATNTILFIGYALEDSNIDYIFNEIVKQLGSNKREMFFIAPSLSEPKKNKLSKLGIQYVQGTGEKFFPLVLDHINKNILLDLKKNKVSADTTYKFTAGIGYNLSLSHNAASSYFAENISKIDGSSTTKVQFTILENNKEFEQLKKMIEGKSTERKIRLSKENLTHFEATLDNFILKNLQEIEYIDLLKLPSYKGNIDVLFEDGFKLIDFQVSFFNDSTPTNSLYSFETKIADGKISFSNKGKSTPLKYESELKDNILDHNLLLKYLTAFSKIISGVHFSVLVDGNIIFQTKLRKAKTPSHLDFFIEYFESIAKVETLYTVRFKEIKRDDVNEGNLFYLQCLIAKKQNIWVSHQLPVMTALLDDDYDKGFLNFNDESHVMFFGENEETIITLHNQKFNLGFMQSFIADAYISNLKDVISKKTKSAKIGSKSNIRQIRFTDNYELPTKENIKL